MLLIGLSAGLTITGVNAETLDGVLSTQAETDKAAAASQKRINDIREDVQDAAARYASAVADADSLEKLGVAAGPLLGLVGTVIGMIITFHAITASGSSDPRIMANGIGQAMIATVLGLGIAIPLLFLNTGLLALSNSITQVLDEQARALLAKSLRDKDEL